MLRRLLLAALMAAATPLMAYAQSDLSDMLDDKNTLRRCAPGTDATAVANRLRYNRLPLEVVASSTGHLAKLESDCHRKLAEDALDASRRARTETEAVQFLEVFVDEHLASGTVALNYGLSEAESRTVHAIVGRRLREAAESSSLSALSELEAGFLKLTVIREVQERQANVRQTATRRRTETRRPPNHPRRETRRPVPLPETQLISN